MPKIVTDTAAGLTLVTARLRYRGAMFNGQTGDWLALVIALAFVAGVIVLSRWLR
jgi:hypothetical protein